jgi:hypothetical protein
MISYTVYKVVHYLGLFVLVAALSASLARLTTPGLKGEAPDPWARRLGSAHGIALFLVLLGGFGMLARLGVTEGLSLPGWIWAKMTIWVVLGGLVALGRRRREWAPVLLAGVPLLAVLAGIIALTKPF